MTTDHAGDMRGTDGPIRTILVVDDEPLIRVTISTYLQECGFIVLQAKSADEAVVLIENSANVVDLVFSDITMPGSIDGLGLAHWLRANRPDLPIILTSSESNRVAIVRQLFANEPFMVKPYDADDVVAQIERSISARAAH
jgi:CheY-like chemotaxis protein